MVFALEWMRRHPLVSYFAIAYALSWTIWIPMAVANARVELGQAWPSHILGLLGPIVAACVMSSIVGGRAELRDLLSRMIRWRIHGKWYVAAVSPLALYACTIVLMELSARAGPIQLDWGHSAACRSWHFH